MSDTHPPSKPNSDWPFVRRVLVVFALAALMAAIWALLDVLLLLFGAMLIALILHAIAEPLQKILSLGRRPAMVLGGGLVVALLGGAALLLGPGLAAEMNNLLMSLPDAANRLLSVFHLGSMSDLIKDGATVSTLGGLASRVIAWTSTAAGALASLLLVIFGGIYLANDPQLYREGFVKLLPPAVHPNVNATLDDAGEALRRWLVGQTIAMVLVGAFTGVGLWLAGVPSAFALGFIAGLAEFVPLIGPILGALPVILIASAQDWQTVILAIGVVVVVQQIESNLIAPLIVSRMVSIAPAVGLFAVVAMGILLGPLGLLLGFPLAIVFDIAVRRLYVRDTLGESVRILGKPVQPSE